MYNVNVRKHIKCLEFVLCIFNFSGHNRAIKKFLNEFHCNMMRHCFMNSGGVNPIDGFILKLFFIL